MVAAGVGTGASHQTRVDRLWGATKLFGPGVASVVAGALLAASGLTPDGQWTQFWWKHVPVNTTLLVGGLVLGVPAYIATAVQLRRIQRRADRADHYEQRAGRAEYVVASIACALVRELFDLLPLDTASRVSLFLDTGTALTLLARHSPNTRYCRCTGQATYPHDRGVLGRAWNLGAAEEKGLASPGQTRDERPDERWIEQQHGRWGIPREEAAALTMRSRSYAAVRLAEPNGRPLGVLIVEDERRASDAPRVGSSGPSAVSCEGLTHGAVDSLQRRLVAVLARAQRLEPSNLRSAVTTVLEDHPRSTR
jgi:hypothetical protein